MGNVGRVMGFPGIEGRIAKAVVLLLTGSLLAACGAGYLRDYVPKDPEEEDIKKTFVAFERAWNSRDEEALTALMDEDFILWVWSGGNRRIVFRKGTFAFNLRDIFIRWRYLSLGSPNIIMKGNDATVNMALSVDGIGRYGTFRLARKEERWVFLEWEF